LLDIGPFISQQYKVNAGVGVASNYCTKHMISKMKIIFIHK